MKILFLSLFTLTSFALTSLADDAPSAKTETEMKTANRAEQGARTGMAQEKLDTMAKKQDYAKQLKECIAAKHDKAQCEKETMTDCQKNMAKLDCKLAIKGK